MVEPDACSQRTFMMHCELYISGLSHSLYEFLQSMLISSACFYRLEWQPKWISQTRTSLTSLSMLSGSSTMQRMSERVCLPAFLLTNDHLQHGDKPSLLNKVPRLPMCHSK